jgi:YfiH family protein
MHGMTTSASIAKPGTAPPAALTSRRLAEAGLPHVFTTRHFPGIARWRTDGPPFSPEALAALAAHGLDGGVPAYARQVHGADVAEVAAGGFQGEADVLVTGRPGVPLAVFTADCLALVVYDPAGGRLAVAHSGWRGTARGAPRAAVGALARAGARPGNLVCAIGPSIGPCCYEVDAPVIAALEAAFPGRWPTWVTPAGPGKWMLDLWRANEDQLADAGVSPGRIDNPRLCTGCGGDIFYSYRRQRGEGRLCAVAAVPAAPGPRARIP